MTRAVLIACVPGFAAMVVCVGLLRLLVAFSGARFAAAHLTKLHRDQSGAVQGLSFVLTLPVFVMLLMLLVQVTQLTAARIIVEYAAFAAARSAIVWIPANLGAGTERENQISVYHRVANSRDGRGNLYRQYDVEPGSTKFNKIHFAAAMACLPICPSRDVGVPRSHPGNGGAASIVDTYFACSPESLRNRRIRPRLQNKLAYALAFTRLHIRIRHKDEEPELACYGLLPSPREFAANEIGWQDQILVTVTHHFALLPGPGRLLARRAMVQEDLQQQQHSASRRSRLPAASRNGLSRQAGGMGVPAVYVYPLTARVQLNNEGEKPALPYIQRSYGGAFGGSTELPVQGEEEPDYDL